jgi:osmotically-inducible protein OsmY
MRTRFAAGVVTLGLALASIGFAADKAGEKTGAATAATTVDKVKENLSDAAITAKIKAEFAKDKQVSALSINVDTDNKGAVTLKGTAKSDEEKAKAESIAKAVAGVTSVKNDIQVSASTRK